MNTLALILALVGATAFAGFLRMNMREWSILTAATLGLFTAFGNVPALTLTVAWIAFAAIAVPLNHRPWRRAYITKPIQAPQVIGKVKELLKVT